MSAKPVIESRTNPLLKRVGAVAAGQDRERILLEGERLVGDALAAGWKLELLLVDAARESDLERFVGDVDERRLVASGLLDRVSALKTAPGVLALAPAPPSRRLADLEFAADALLLVVAGVADPGNFGALARSAEAAGASALCVLPGGVSPWNPKALRGSMGSLLRVPVCVFDSPRELADELDALGARSVRAETRGGTPWRAFDWSGRIALWVGAETGSTPDLARGFEGVSIPMAGAAESLNVTVATSLLLFAAGRAEGGAR
ncbi:MAG: RNA methyltransferase [Planctomycetes bacterium]|nr:RNA methyltransferase [Planctomycetota bacterium]MCB9904946.1 RNA methyltransferase [Planctomycetota bacterium]